MANRRGKRESSDTIFLGSKITAYGECSHEIKRHLLPGRKTMTNPDSILKCRDITLPVKVHIVKAMVFPVVMYGCESWDYKESWVPKNWCLQTAVLQKTLESPLDCKEIKPAHPKGDQPWRFIRRTDADGEALILWPPDRKSRLTGKDPDAGKDGRQKKKRAAEDEMVSITNSMDMNLSKLQEILEDGRDWDTEVQGVTKSQSWQQLNNIHMLSSKPSVG